MKMKEMHHVACNIIRNGFLCGIIDDVYILGAFVPYT